MKRLLPIAVALAFAAFVTACDQNNANRPAGSGSTADQQKPADQQKRSTPAPTSPSKP